MPQRSLKRNGLKKTNNTAGKEKEKMTTANKITILRVLLVPFFIYFIYNIEKPCFDIISAILFIIISITDFLDGYIARKYNQITTFGKFMDPLADKILVTSALIMLTQLGKFSGVIAVIIIAREFLVSAIRQLAAADGTVLAAAWSGKVKTTFQMIGIIVIILENYLNAIYPLPYGTFFSVIMLVLTVYSGGEYLIKNRKLISFK